MFTPNYDDNGNKENEINIKKEIEKYMRELKLLKAERDYLETDFKICERTISDENTCSVGLRQVLTNYSTKLSNITSSCDVFERAFSSLLKISELQQSNCSFDDSSVVKTLLLRLTFTIQMYDNLKLKYRLMEEKLEKSKSEIIETNESLLPTRTQTSPIASDCNVKYLHTGKLLFQLKKFLDKNQISKSLFASKVLGMSLVKFIKSFSKPTPWLCCKTDKRECYVKIRNFLRDINQVTELQNYALLYGNPKLNVPSELSVASDLQPLDDTLYLDTYDLSRRMNSHLRTFNLRQVDFAQKVLNLSKIAFSKLVNNPIKWENCKTITKQHYLKMHEFLADPSVYNIHQEGENSLLSKIQFLGNNESDEDTLDDQVVQQHEEAATMSDYMDHADDEDNSNSIQMLNGTEQSNVLSFFNSHPQLEVAHELNGINLDELRLKVQNFLKKYQLGNRHLAENLLGVSKRSFLRLMNNQVNLSNCKLTTRENLFKLMSFLNDEKQIKEFVSQHSNNDKSLTYKIQPQQQQQQQSIQLQMIPVMKIQAVQTGNTAAAGPSAMDENSHRNLANRVKRFFNENKINLKDFAIAMFGISKRAFSRLLTKPAFNWANCKPATKERLIRLKAFFDDQNGLHQFLVRFKADGTMFIPAATIGAGDDDDDDDEEDEEEDEEEEEDEDSHQSAAVVDSTTDGSEIDLKDLSKRVYKFLKDNQLSQRLFAQKLLGITKTHFNKLISKPQKWSNCKLVTRRHYITLVEFLNDKRRIHEFLSQIENEKKQPILSLASAADTPCTSRQSNSFQLDTAALSRQLKSLLLNKKIQNEEHLLSYLNVPSYTELYILLSQTVDWNNHSNNNNSHNEVLKRFFLKLNSYLSQMNNNGDENHNDDDDDNDEDSNSALYDDI